jgi:NAD(P)-dependent dehydrogenase (short-subunit alcohol dehydrogenase family)
MDYPSTKTTTWTSDELSRIEAAQELEIAPLRRDGTLRKPVPIWVVRVGDDLYVRAAYGAGTSSATAAATWSTSSVAGRTARPGNAVYAATKWGMTAWSESLRQELQPDIRVMVIEPGAVATELTDHITHSDTKQAVEQMYDEMSITADDIAEVIAFAVGRPRRTTLNEILVRPTGQAL